MDGSSELRHDEEWSRGSARQLVARVFGPISWVHTALFWSGAGCCVLGAVLVALALHAPAHSSDAASLLIAGLAILCGGSGACILGWTRRANWVALDDVAVSRPWARGKPGLPLKTLSGIQESSRGGVSVSSTSGTHLRIAGDLPDFQELVDLLCDRITENGYPETATAWPHSKGNITVSAREVRARWVGQDQPGPVGWAEIRELWLDRDERRRLVVSLTLDDDRVRRFPHIGPARTLQLYRALRQTLRQRRQPFATGARRQLRERNTRDRARGVVLGIVLIGGLAGAVLGAQRGCHPSLETPARERP
jgi:hypothetical protein